MTKKEYIDSRCKGCGNCDGSEYHQHHCPIVDEMDSAWEVCAEHDTEKERLKEELDALNMRFVSQVSMWEALYRQERQKTVDDICGWLTNNTFRNTKGEHIDGIFIAEELRKTKQIQ